MVWAAVRIRLQYRTKHLQSMNRRTILQLTGATFATEIGADYIGNRQENEDDEEPTCDPDIRFGEQDLIIDESGFTSRAYAEIVVENVGDAPSGEISVTAAWMDEGGSFIDDDSARLPSLRAGETWFAYVSSLIDPEDINDFEASGEFEVGHPRSPPGITVTESDYDPGDNEITGVAENTREEDIERVEAQGKIYDEGGLVLGGGSTWERDHPAGRDWNFEIRTPRLPGGIESAGYTVVLDARTFQIQG